ncbi:hypothetical protein CVT26_009261 [Gymnopilus dilepis]|uniref:Uncharacterized protein n=1 Tax=Gymnopilus dilepis TaxID=231916 RepID=A0A409XC64_9AGAR|nr:hypothetical protein CVT26_009261 [Gymnopilus dilepis]
MDYAFKWIDLSIWKGIMKLRSCTLQVIGIEPLLRALDLFSFEAVRINLEDILARSIHSPDRLRLMLKIRSKVSTPRDNQIFDHWFQKELEKILSSCAVATANDVPGVLDIIRLAGFTTFLNIYDSIMPKLLQKRGNYFFWISFYKTVRERRERILEEEARLYQNSDKATTDGQARRAEILDRIIKDCLQAAATRWMDSDAARFDKNPYGF